MQTKVNINIAVDVVAALTQQTLHKNIFFMDNSISNSLYEGTEYLTTKCQAGQMIKWNIYAIDLQTPIVIKNISFINDKSCDVNKENSNAEYSEKNNPDAKTWTGIVPWYMTPNVPYKYRLEVQMGEGPKSILSIDSACLMRV